VLTRVGGEYTTDTDVDDVVDREHHARELPS
jgi:hypothetical protein